MLSSYFYQKMFQISAERQLRREKRRPDNTSSPLHHTTVMEQTLQL